MTNLIERLRKEIEAKQAEIVTLNNSLGMLLRSSRATCTHPNMKQTLYEEDCPDCGHYRERSF